MDAGGGLLMRPIFVALAFWQFPVMVHPSMRQLINTYLTDPWVQA